MTVSKASNEVQCEHDRREVEERQLHLTSQCDKGEEGGRNDNKNPVPEKKHEEACRTLGDVNDLFHQGIAGLGLEVAGQTSSVLKIWWRPTAGRGRRSRAGRVGGVGRKCGLVEWPKGRPSAACEYIVSA